MNASIVARAVLACTRVYKKPQETDYDELLGALVVAPELTAADVEGDELLVDVHYAVVAVSRAGAEKRREEFVDELRAFPEPARLALGINHLELAEHLGDHELSLRALAMGAALGLWDVMTPASLGFVDEEAAELARNGLVFSSGFRG